MRFDGQMLVAISGENLSTSAATLASYPWPPQLAGSIVTFNGVPASLAYVSPSQINAVVPSALDGATGADVVVTTAAGASAPVPVTVTDSALGIFTQNMTGCGQASALNVHSDGTISLNTPDNSLDPVGDLGLTMFLTGLGAFPDRTDGVPWQYDLSDNREASVNAMFGIPNLGMYSPPLTVTYAGPAPTLSGVDQVNVQFFYFPNMLTGIGQAMAPEGCRIPLYLTNPTSASQIVNVSIHRNGGTCSDSPANTLGTVTWQQNVVRDVATSSSSSGIAIQFLQDNGLSFPQTPGANFGEGSVTPEPALCAAARP